MGPDRPQETVLLKQSLVKFKQNKQTKSAALHNYSLYQNYFTSEVYLQASIHSDNTKIAGYLYTGNITCSPSGIPALNNSFKLFFKLILKAVK